MYSRVHVLPSSASLKPSLHSHLNDPKVLIHVCEQPPFPALHSSLSAKNDGKERC